MVKLRPRRSATKTQQQLQPSQRSISQIQVPKRKTGSRASKNGPEDFSTPVQSCAMTSQKIFEDKENNENLLSLQSNQILQSVPKPIPDFLDRFPNLAPDYELIARVDKQAKKLAQEAEEKLHGILNPVWEEDGWQGNGDNQHERQNQDLSVLAEYETDGCQGNGSYQNENMNENMSGLTKMVTEPQQFMSVPAVEIVEPQGIGSQPSRPKKALQTSSKNAQGSNDAVPFYKQNGSRTIARRKRNNMETEENNFVKKSKVDSLVVVNEVNMTKGVVLSGRVSGNKIQIKKEENLMEKLQQSQQQVVYLEKVLKERNQVISTLKARETQLKRELQVAKDETKAAKTQKAEQENNRQNNLRKAQQLVEMATELANSIKYQRKI